MIQILLIVYVIFKIYYLNKPLTGDPSKDNDIRKFVKARANRSSGSRLLALFWIGVFTFATFVSAIIFCKCFKADGAYAFYGKSINLNECVRDGELPEEHSYVTLTFNMVGQKFDPIHPNTRVYYPVILDNGDDKPNVFAIYVTPEETPLFDEYAEVSAKKIAKGKSDSGEETIQVTGRIVNFLDEMEQVYDTAVSDSGIKEKDYEIIPMVINTDIDQKEERDRLVWILAIVHSMFTFAFLLTINYLIDEGKLD